MDFSKKLKNKIIAVFGLGKSGISTIVNLNKFGVKIYAWDDNVESVDRLNSLRLDNVIGVHQDKFPWKDIYRLVLSPGIPLTHPEPHDVVKLANKHKCRIICDVELLNQINNKATYIGITGTNGKSTTTSLIGHILKSDKLKVDIGGNLGIAALDLNNFADDGIYVLELSSYQIDLLYKSHFDITVLLNISPDHIERHGSLSGYIKAKSKIFNNQTKDDFAIISIDDQYCKKIYSDLCQKDKLSQVFPISVKERIYGGVSIIDGILYNDIENKDEFGLDLKNLNNLPGEHNAQNIAASYVVSWLMGISNEKFVEYVSSFQGLKHRMQIVFENQNVKFINDSKATNVVSTSKALNSFENIYWIAGGMAKEEGIEHLEEYYKRVKHVYLIGDAEEKFSKSLDGKLKYTKCGDLTNAFNIVCKDIANNKKNEKIAVLLSPLCASFDQWASFEARGDAFCDLVEKYVVNSVE